ncbi:11709_t:CDS:2 [Funneliformis caledonium]|uniref:11709_t:CDS:1 n=1 Tax=Funneliformis caledonium TaxID=1117310 RepID=A0A9N9GKP1_9GLOM|nr:11709_t:CDS:2 [Funneliformis caledonium]
MSEHDFESINRRIISNEENDDEADDNGLCYDFEIDSLFPKENNQFTNIYEKESFERHILVVDSVSNQTFITREIVSLPRATRHNLNRLFFFANISELKMSNLEEIVKE